MKVIHAIIRKNREEKVVEHLEEEGFYSLIRTIGEIDQVLKNHGAHRGHRENNLSVNSVPSVVDFIE